MSSTCNPSPQPCPEKVDSLSAIMWTNGSLEQQHDTYTAIQPKKRRRRINNKEELSVLEEAFHKNSLPSLAERQELANHLGMSVRSVHIWFQNKRQSLRKKSSPQEDENIHHKQDPACHSQGINNVVKIRKDHNRESSELSKTSATHKEFKPMTQKTFEFEVSVSRSTPVSQSVKRNIDEPIKLISSVAYKDRELHCTRVRMPGKKVSSPCPMKKSTSFNGRSLQTVSLPIRPISSLPSPAPKCNSVRKRHSSKHPELQSYDSDKENEDPNVKVLSYPSPGQIASKPRFNRSHSMPSPLPKKQATQDSTVILGEKPLNLSITRDSFTPLNGAYMRIMCASEDGTLMPPTPPRSEGRTKMLPMTAESALRSKLQERSEKRLTNPLKPTLFKKVASLRRINSLNDFSPQITVGSKNFGTHVNLSISDLPNFLPISPKENSPLRMERDTTKTGPISPESSALQISGVDKPLIPSTPLDLLASAASLR